MEQKATAVKKNGSRKRHIFQRVSEKIRTNADYRERVLLTLCIYISFTVIGATKGQLGPVLLDLMAISGVDLGEGALIVTFLYIGYTIGAMLNGFLHHRFRRSSLFSFCCFWMGITMSVIPWCSYFVLMLGAHAFLGLFQGVVDAGGNAEVINLWGKDIRTLVVGLHLFFNIGGVLSPLIIAPYLMKDVVKRNTSYHEVVPQYTSNCTNGRDNVTLQWHLISRSSNINLTESNTSFGNTTILELDGQEFSSEIHIAYIISAVSCFLVAFLFMSVYFTKHWKCFIHSTGATTENSETGGEVSKKESNKLQLTKTFKIVALVVMITIATLSKAIDHAFAAYLSTFCVEALHWSTQASSYLTSAYFVCVVIGGACGTLMTKVTSLVIHAGFQVVLMLVSFVCLAFSVTHSAAAGIWIAASLFGFAKSVIFPLTLAWTNDSFVKVSGKISSVFFTSTMAGSVTNPLLLGYIMTKFSKMWFCYFFLFESILLFIFYIIAVLLTKHSKHISRKNDSEQFDIT